MVLLCICCLTLMVLNGAMSAKAQGGLGGLTGAITNPTGAAAARPTARVTNRFSLSPILHALEICGETTSFQANK